MSGPEQSYFIPYEESGYPEQEKRTKEFMQANHIPTPEGYTLKKCEAYIGLEQICGKPARWVHVTPKSNRLFEMAVCDEHKTEGNGTSTPISVDADRVVTYDSGDVLYYLTVRDDIVGEFTVRIWLNQQGGQILPWIVHEIPSPLIRQLRERKG